MNDLSHFDIVLAPLVTEKAVGSGEFNKYVFKVASSASKTDIKRSVEQLFNVQVSQVNTLITKGKVKRFRNKPGRRSDVKKAVVTLKDGFSIDTTTGI